MFLNQLPMRCGCIGGIALQQMWDSAVSDNVAPTGRCSRLATQSPERKPNGTGKQTLRELAAHEA